MKKITPLYVWNDMVSCLPKESRLFFNMFVIGFFATTFIVGFFGVDTSNIYVMLPLSFSVSTTGISLCLCMIATLEHHIENRKIKEKNKGN